MLLSFRVSNHRSLRDEQQLLLTPAYAGDGPPEADWEAVPVIGIFGANASGKSNVIDALAYMQRMVVGSLRESEPGTGINRDPFMLDSSLLEEPSGFVADLLLDGTRYTYGFALDNAKILEEWLYAYPLKQKRTIFHRRGGLYKYGDHPPKSMKQVEEITESNVLFLSVAVRSRQKSVLPVYEWFRELDVRYPDSLRPYSTSFNWNRNDPELVRRLSDLLRAADTGIEGVEVIEESEQEFAARMARRGNLRAGSNARAKVIYFRHRGAEGGTLLRLRNESSGTQALYALAIPAFRSLDQGAVLAIDEIESSLHSYLTAQLIRLFRDPATNPRGAQLIFSSHDAALLGRIRGEEVLSRDQIWFTEKDEDGATGLFPLTEFKPRKEENRERRYLAGRYGAVPILNDELFAAAVEMSPTDVE